MKRLFIYASLCWLFFLGLGGCGRTVILSGETCKSDLKLFEKEKGRFGCIIMPHVQEGGVYAVYYKADPIGGQFYYCSSYDKASCVSPMLGFSSARAVGQPETAVLAFPPKSFTKGVGRANIKGFLNLCAKVFDPAQPVLMECSNDGKNISEYSHNCWFLFYFSFDRKTKVGTCKPLQKDS